MATYTTTDIINAIKRRGQIPSSQSTFADSDIIAILNEEMQSGLVPLVMSVRQEYFVADSDTTMAASTSGYAIPQRAIGGDLRDVYAVRVSNSQTRALIRMEPEAAVGQPVSNGTPLGYYLKDNHVVLVPTPNDATETLRLSYHRRPNTLVAYDAASLISAINTGTNTITTTNAHAFSTSTPVDLVQSKPPFRWLAVDQTPTAVGGSTVTFSSLPSGLAVGDHINLATEAMVPQIPVELHPILTLRVVAAIAEGLGDNELASSAKSEIREKQQLALTLIANRVKSGGRKIPNGFTKWSTGSWEV